ncbi:hypothetical protein, partial [Bilophila sp.]|uniref:hypothetical protein n=1 Tax=Bilophila sp. TaxID=1929485 RepID=UPI0030776670
FSGYPFGVSRKKASTVFYDTAKEKRRPSMWGNGVFLLRKQPRNLETFSFGKAFPDSLLTCSWR